MTLVKHNPNSFSPIFLLPYSFLLLSYFFFYLPSFSLPLSPFALPSQLHTSPSPYTTSHPTPSPLAYASAFIPSSPIKYTYYQQSLCPALLPHPQRLPTIRSTPKATALSSLAIMFASRSRAFGFWHLGEHLSPPHHRFRLNLADGISAFVRGMLKACPTQPFDFPMSDPEIETSEAIRLWLGKACNPSSNAVSTLRQEYLLMHLARKYLCDPMIDDIKRRLFSRVERSAITYEDYFIFAATFDDAAMAAKVVRAPKVTGKANAKIAAIHRAAGLSPGKSATNGVSNPLGWSGRTRRETPMDYFWALAYVFMDSNFIEITGDAFLMALQKERKEIREEGKGR